MLVYLCFPVIYQLFMKTFVYFYKINFIEMNNIDWTKRKKLGKPKALKSAQHMWDLAVKYFEEVDNNPLTRQEAIKGGDLAGSTIEVDLRRPYTWSGFSVFLFLNGVLQNLDNYKANTNGDYDEYREVVYAIDQIMKTQKFEGAAAGIFSANIIARDLGLADKTDVTSKGESISFGSFLKKSSVINDRSE